MSEAGNFVSTRRSEGRQRLAARACDEHAFCFMRSRRTFSTLPCVPCAVALASRALCCPRVHCPATGDEVTFPSARVLLLRPCRLRRADARAMGNATCWVITAPRVLPLGCCRRARCPSSMPSRVCREGDARVARNVRLADMNLDVPVADERRIEVVADGLPLWHGSQLALDATIVLPPHTTRRDPPPRKHPAGLRSRFAAARRKRHRTYPELGRARRRRLVVLGTETGGRFNTETVQFLRLLARHRAAAVPMHLSEGSC